MEALVGVIVGAIITWFVSRWYYEKSGKDLQKEAESLRKLNILMIRALEDAGFASFRRDNNGDPFALIINESVTEKVFFKSKPNE